MTVTTHNPHGHASVTPYLMVHNAQGLIDFLTQLFSATIRECHQDEQGKIMHAELNLGDTIVMLADSSEDTANGTFYVYVDEVDKVYSQSIQLGAQSLSEPANQEYGARVAQIKDPFGNIWALAKELS